MAALEGGHDAMSSHVRLQGGFGSRVPVEPVACILACNAATGCDSFSYNPDQKRCFLKTGASSDTCMVGGLGQR